MSDQLPSIQEVAASFQGGTTSDPNLVLAPPAPEVAEPVEVEEVQAEEAVVTEEVQVEEKPKRDPQAARFAALARREKELRSQNSKVEQQLKAMETREAEIRAREERFSRARRPMDILKESGFTYADITQDLMGNYKEPEADPLDEKLNPLKQKWDEFEPTFKQVKDELEQLKNQLALKEQRAVYESAVADIKSALSVNEGETYELTNAMGDEGVNLVQDVIIRYYEQNEILLDFSQACDIVEKYYESEASKFAATKKYKSRTQPVTEAAPKQVVKPKEVREPSTLTQNLTTGTQAKVNIDEMSHHDAINYLAKKLQFK